MTSPPKRTYSASSPDDEGPSPKRQRRSPSPASPPTDVKAASAHPPHTPTSVHMSPEWSAQQLPGLGLGTTNESPAFPTPPSTAGLHGHLMARGLSSEGVSQTPAYGSESQAANKTAEDVPAMQTQPQQEGLGDVDEVMSEAVDVDHRRSDHERQEAASLPGATVLYKLQTAPIQPSAPQLSQDLIKLYSLEQLQASVARRDPETGAKINKLRKSYEGKLKDLELAGRNKATKSEAILEGLVDSGWDMKDGENRSLWEGSDLCDPPLLGADGATGAFGRIESLLGRALDLRPGRLPANEHNAWKNLLGLDDPTSVVPPTKATAATPASATTAPKIAAPNVVAKTAPATALRTSAPSSPHSNTGIRPDRVGKKRKYDESSYAGYQEGYEDDSGGMDDSGGRRGSAGSKRQKRKDYPTSSNSPPFATNAGTNNNMVAMRSS